eukprot:1372368-Rhodomonas_salina.3
MRKPFSDYSTLLLIAVRQRAKSQPSGSQMQRKSTTVIKRFSTQRTKLRSRSLWSDPIDEYCDTRAPKEIGAYAPSAEQ